MAEPISVEDLENAKLDVTTIAEVSNVGTIAETTTNRNGDIIDTITGRLNRLDWLPAVAYGGGIGFTVNDGTKTIERSGFVYAPRNSEIPFTTTGTWVGDDEDKFFLIPGQSGGGTGGGLEVTESHTGDFTLTANLLGLAEGTTIQSGNVFETMNGPTAMAFDENATLWIVDGGDNLVAKFVKNDDEKFIRQSYSIPTVTATPVGITFSKVNDTFGYQDIWITFANATCQLFQADNKGRYTPEGTSFSTSSQTSNPRDVAMQSNGNLWICGNGGTVYEYQDSGGYSYTGTFIDLATNDPKYIDFTNDDKMWLGGSVSAVRLSVELADVGVGYALTGKQFSPTPTASDTPLGLACHPDYLSNVWQITLQALSGYTFRRYSISGTTISDDGANIINKFLNAGDTIVLPDLSTATVSHNNFSPGEIHVVEELTPGAQSGDLTRDRRQNDQVTVEDATVTIFKNPPRLGP